MAINSIFSYFLISLICLESKSIIPHQGNTYSLSFLLATPSSPSRALLLELQRYKVSIRCARLGAEVSGHHQKHLMQTLIVLFLKTHFFTQILDCKSQQNRIELETWYTLVFEPECGLAWAAIKLFIDLECLVTEVCVTWWDP